ncbi:MAG: LytTR family DNA-binding domain-containing protein [Reichenbachiella sp.]|uniref:LytR/AlgR family response regulator transcription factor n=1 Tax=Reichenbachiella sp. TaxID=2184521 RepID=UPI0032660902
MSVPKSNYTLKAKVLNRIAKHFIYWIALIVFFGVVWGTSDDNYYRNFAIQLYSLPSRLILVYATLYVLIPHFFLKKRFISFTIFYFLLLTIVSLAIQRPVMLYHVQPTYLPDWNVSNFFTVTELMNTILDVNLAAVIPLGASFYRIWLSSNSQDQKLEKGTAESSEEEKFIYLKVEKRLEKIFFKDIVYIESLKNYIKVKTTEKEIVAYKSLTAMQNSLPESKFLRVHRSFIICLDFVDSFSPNQITLRDENIPIGRSYKKKVKKMLGYF